MRTVFTAVLAASLLAAPAYAKKFELPPANPAVTVDLPDAWKPDEIENGVQAVAPDGETYVSVETGTSKSTDKLIEEDFAYLTKTAGVTIDEKSQQSADTTVNGMPVSVLRWKGKDKDGPNNVTIRIFGVTENLIVLVTTTSTPTGDSSNSLAIETILNSLKKQ